MKDIFVIEQAWFQDGWILAKLIVGVFMYRDEAILTEQAWSIKNSLYGQKKNFLLWDQRGKSRAGKMGPSSLLG